jgi:hypothetical protein
MFVKHTNHNPRTSSLNNQTFPIIHCCPYMYKKV